MKMSSLFYQVFTINGAPVELNLQGKTDNSEKTCPSATTNLTWTDPGSNPGLRGERPATNRQSHGTAFMCRLHLWTFQPYVTYVLR
jgi:hypothetical protein